MYQLAPDEFIEANLDMPDARPLYVTFALPQSH